MVDRRGDPFIPEGNCLANFTSAVSPLWIAASERRADDARRIAQLDRDAPGPLRTAFQYACLTKNDTAAATIIAALSPAGAGPSEWQKNDDLGEYLLIAADYGRARIVEHLRARGVPGDARKNRALCRAAAAGHGDVVSALINPRPFDLDGFGRAQPATDIDVDAHPGAPYAPPICLAARTTFPDAAGIVGALLAHGSKHRSEALALANDLLASTAQDSVARTRVETTILHLKS